jgi:chitinase
MMAKLFSAKGSKLNTPAKIDLLCSHPLSRRSRLDSKRISVSLVVLLLCTALLAACTNGTATSNSQEDTTTSTTSNSSFFGGITQLKMFDASNGWATSSSAVLKTNDGGQHWTDVTPADWEATTTSQDGSSNPNNKGVSAAFFLNAQDAWIVTSNSSSVEDQIAATAEASSTPTINAQMQVYVRATTDGGSTWVDANPITVTNLSLLYPPYFINPHEGWLVLTATNTQGNQRSALVYHSTNGGITWQQISTLSGISSSDSVAGLTMAPNCPSQCPASSPVSSPGCTTNGTSDTFGWLAYANKSSLWLKETNDSGSLWSNLDWSTPGGAPGQSNDSLIVAAPPILFTDGTGVLPIQMQSNPDSNDPSNFYLHLYKMSLNGSAGALQTNLSSTSPFVVQQIAAYHTLSAPDLSHIFVLGQTLNGDTSSNTHLYEWNGSSWQTLTSQISSTDATSGSDLSSLDNGSSPTNLDFISDTEGWATSDSSLYHILLNGTTASWTQVYPPANSTNTVTRTPGQVLSAPANPTACDNTSTNSNNTGKSSTNSNSGLPAHILTGYWQDFTNGATPVRLSDVNPGYDLIAVAFATADPTTPGAVTFSIDAGLSSALGGYTSAQFTSDIAALHKEGKKVIISIGGQNGTVSVNDAASATNFANSVANLMKTYGFDGVDIDFENGMNPTYMASALQQLSAKEGSSLIITLAPQTVDMQSTSSDYFQLALSIKNILTVVNMQYYNSGAMNGCDGKVYAEGSVDFLTALACIQLLGGLSANQVALGLPASTSAASSGYVAPTVINNALDCLAQGKNCGSFKPSTPYPDIRGVMTWSISWDAANSYNFATTVKSHLNSLP